MTIQGLRTTSNFVTDERPKNWREGILLRYPNGTAPLTALTSLMKTRVVDDPEFNWWEKALQTRSIALTTSITAGTTTLAATAGGCLAFKANDLLLSVKTSEVMRVASDPSSDTALSVIRAWTGTATAITITVAGTDPTLYCIGSVNEEGSAGPSGVNFDVTKKNNYCQIFRNNLEATRTALKTRLRTGDQAREAKRECLELHGIDMERAFFFGTKLESTINGKPARTTDGVIARVDTSRGYTWGATGPTGSSYSGTTKFSDLEVIMREIFQFGSSEKMVFCGDVALLNLQQLIRNAKGILWDLKPDKEFGMNVTRVTCPFGTLVFKLHPLFLQMAGGTVGGTAYYNWGAGAVVVDMANLVYAPLTDSDTKYVPDQQSNGVDGLKAGYLTEAGLEIHHGITHAYIKNFATFTAE